MAAPYKVRPALSRTSSSKTLKPYVIGTVVGAAAVESNVQLAKLSISFGSNQMVAENDNIPIEMTDLKPHLMLQAPPGYYTILIGECDRMQPGVVADPLKPIVYVNFLAVNVEPNAPGQSMKGLPGAAWRAPALGPGERCRIRILVLQQPNQYTFNDVSDVRTALGPREKPKLDWISQVIANNPASGFVVLGPLTDVNGAIRNFTLTDDQFIDMAVQFNISLPPNTSREAIILAIKRTWQYIQ